MAGFRGPRVEFDGTLQAAPGRRQVPVVEEPHQPQRDMRLGDFRIQLDGPLGRLLRRGVGLFAGESAGGPEVGVAASDPCMGEGEARVQRQGITEMAECLLSRVRRPLVPAVQTPKVKAVRLGALGGLPHPGRLLRHRHREQDA